MVLVGSFCGPQLGLAILIKIALSTLHDPVQFPGIGLVHQFPTGCTAQGDDGIPVGHRRDAAGVGADGFADLGGKILQFSHGRVLAKDHAPVLFGINLQRVAFPDLEGSSDFLGNHDSAQIV